MQILTKEYVDKYEPSKPTASDLEKMETFSDVSPTKKVKNKNDKHDKKKKKSDKHSKKTDRRGKIGGKKNGKKPSVYPEKPNYSKPTKRPTPPPKGSLDSFLDYFENRRRLLVSMTLYSHFVKTLLCPFRISCMGNVIAQTII